jgi:hypothetical protein
MRAHTGQKVRRAYRKDRAPKRIKGSLKEWAFHHAQLAARAPAERPYPLGELCGRWLESKRRHRSR